MTTLALVPAAPVLDESPSVAARPVAAKGYTYGGAARTGWWQGLDEAEKTPELVWPLSVEVFDQMRRSDPQIGAVLRALTLPILRTSWRISPNGARPEVVRLVADDLGLPVLGEEGRPVVRTRDRFSWQEHLRHALLMLPFGHAFFEQEYRYNPADRYQHLHRLGWRPPRSIQRLEIAPDGMLDWIQQEKRPGTPGADGPIIEVRSLVCYVNEREGGNWLGKSILRPAYKPWILKEEAQRIQQLTLVRNGLGIPDYEAPPIPDSVTDPEARRILEQAAVDNGQALVRNLRAGDLAGVSRPGGSNLTLRGVEGALPDAQGQIRGHNEEIARGVLAGFMTLGGSDSTGSYALGDTFLDFFVMGLQVEAKEIADVTNQHVIEDLVDVNFGPSEPAPLLEFEEIGATHPATAAAMKILVDAGILRPDDPLETATRTKFRLPAADPASARAIPVKTGSSDDTTGDQA